MESVEEELYMEGISDRREASRYIARWLRTNLQEDLHFVFDDSLVTNRIMEAFTKEAAKKIDWRQVADAIVPEDVSAFGEDEEDDFLEDDEE